jgi:tetratricopeptide (TPR) repeat protein
MMVDDDVAVRRLADAKRKLAEGLPREALRDLGALLASRQIEPHDEREALLARALCYLRLGDERAALADAEQVLEDVPRDADALVLKARARQALEQWPACVEAADAALAERDDADAYFARAYAKGKLGDVRGAVEDWDAYVELRPDDADGWEQRGRRRLDAGEYRRAVGDLDSAAALDPARADRLAASTALGGRLLALVAPMVSRSRTAPVTGTVTGTVPPDAPSPGDVARACVEEGHARQSAGEPRTAAIWYNRAIDAKADVAEAWRARGVLRYQLGRVAEALSDLGHALDLDPIFHLARYNRAFVRARALDFAGAEEDATRFLEHAPDDVESLIHRGAMRRHLGRHGEALADFARALELSPSSSAAFFHRGLTKAEGGDAAGAEDDFTHALVLDATDPRIWTARARARRERGDEEGARADEARAAEPPA